MARTGSQALPLGPIGVGQPRWLTLLHHSEAAAAARVVRVAMSAPEGDEYSREAAVSRMPAGIWWNIDRGDVKPWVGGGALRFRYGSGGALRTIFLDLAPGEYQLPPCKDVTIDAATWQPFAMSTRPAVTLVSADLDDGMIADPSPMLVHARRRHGADGDGRLFVSAPPGAYAVELEPDESSALTMIAGSARAVRDFAGNVWLPPTTPIVIGPSWSGSGYTQIEIQGPAAMEWDASLCFWVR